LQSLPRILDVPSAFVRCAARRLWATLALLGLLAVVLVVPTAARAADDPAARSLFEAGQQLMEEGNPDAACPKFEESLRLQPSVGAQLNLARCHEQQGKLATAWTEYKKAATMARAAGDAEREKGANDLADVLKPKVPKLVVTVVKPVKGMVVLKDATELGAAAYGVAIAADPGPHRIEATAPGYKSWAISVDVPSEPLERVVEVPELEIDPNAPAPSSVASPAGGPGTGPAGAGDSGQALFATGIALGVTGVVAAGIGAVLGGLVLSDTSKVDGDPSLCPNKQCTVAGQEIIDSARSKATASSVLIPVGGALAVAGVVLLFVGSQGSGAASTEEDRAPADASQAPTAQLVPVLGPQTGGLMVLGTF
jgi:hypothetical protein